MLSQIDDSYQFMKWAHILKFITDSKTSSKSSIKHGVQVEEN